MSVTREQVVAALVNKLATITTANGYSTNFGGRVYVWHDYELAAASCPCLLVNDTEEQTADYQSNGEVLLLTVELTMVAAKGCTPAQARAMITDLRRCLPVSEQLGGLVSWSKIAAVRLTMAQHDQVVAAVAAELTFRYIC